MNSVFRPALVLFGALTLVTGVVYPAIVTGIAKVAFPTQAAGSLLTRDGKVVGSSLIGQTFNDPRNFWGRPSATSPMTTNAVSSSGSNLGPTNSALTDAIKGRIEALHAADPHNTLPIPVDLVTASASGLDPEISVAAAQYQATRISAARNIPIAKVEALIDTRSEGRVLGFLGEPRVNVLSLNLALDKLQG